MPLPFGLKAPSKGTLIFSGIAGALSGIIYTSNKNAEESRRKVAQRVAHLADRPCGVHEMPRKVTIYISAPPGDGLEKSRTWFREYVKPVLVAGAVDYEVKEAKEPGQIEKSVMEAIIEQRLEAESSIMEIDEQQQQGQQQQVANPFVTPNVKEMISQQLKKRKETDGILAIGRNAYREVLSGLAKGCEASLEQKNEEVEKEKPAEMEQQDQEELISEDIQQVNNEVQDEVRFSLPPKFEPVMYIPHVNIIGWSNIPYRLYMWYADYKRIEEVGKYTIAAVLNQTRPMEPRDADKGQEEKKYWIGDEKVEELKKNDEPIVIDERIMDKLTTYTSDELP